MPKLKIKCDVCFEIIAEADTDTLVQPITGSMFASPDPHHGLEAPFHASLTWETMRCPYCRTRPFLVDHEIMTTEGAFLIPEAKQEGYGEAISPKDVGTSVSLPSPWEIAEQKRKEKAAEYKKKTVRRKRA